MSTESTRAVLLRCRELFEKALPKFNWAASALPAEAIKLLNDVPLEVQRELAKPQSPQYEVVGYYMDSAPVGRPPGYYQVSDEYSQDPDIVILYKEVK